MAFVPAHHIEVFVNCLIFPHLRDLHATSSEQPKQLQVATWQ